MAGERVPVVVLEGANSDCSARQEKKHLMRLALNNEIRLVMTDITPAYDVRPGEWDAAGFQATKTIVEKRSDRVKFIVKNPKDDVENAARVKGALDAWGSKADLVIINAPNQVHLPIIKFWLNRQDALLNQRGAIVTQKPLSDKLEEAEELLLSLPPEQVSKVYVFGDRGLGTSQRYL